jgi:hypothetical protein
MFGMLPADSTYAAVQRRPWLSRWQLSLQTMSHDGPAHDQPPRWNGAPSQDLLVIRRNHRTGVARSAPLGPHPELAVDDGVMERAAALDDPAAHAPNIVIL